MQKIRLTIEHFSSSPNSCKKCAKFGRRRFYPTLPGTIRFQLRSWELCIVGKRTLEVIASRGQRNSYKIYIDRISFYFLRELNMQFLLFHYRFHFNIILTRFQVKKKPRNRRDLYGNSLVPLTPFSIKV